MKKTKKKYNLKYYCDGTSVGGALEGVTEEQVNEFRELMKDPNNVIKITSKNSTSFQLLPVRNIKVVDVVEAKQ